MKYGFRKKVLPNKEIQEEQKKYYNTGDFTSDLFGSWFVFKKSPEEKQEVIEVIPTKDELAFDNIPDDTISELDTLNITDSSLVEQPVETTIPVVKKSKIKITDSS